MIPLNIFQYVSDYSQVANAIREPAFGCMECGFRSNVKAELESHLITHTGENGSIGANAEAYACKESSVFWSSVS